MNGCKAKLLLVEGDRFFHIAASRNKWTDISEYGLFVHGWMSLAGWSESA
jgi:hypothetical protein